MQAGTFTLQMPPVALPDITTDSLMSFLAGNTGRLVFGAIVAGGVAALIYAKFRTPPAEASYQRGVQLAAVQMVPEARDAYLEAIKRDPSYAPPYRALAEMSASQRAFQASTE